MELLLKTVLILTVGTLVVGIQKRSENEIGIQRRNENETIIERHQKSFEKYLGSMLNFSRDMYTELSAEKPGKNLIFSPYSIESALMMTILGAKGETWRQLRAGMRMGMDRRLRNNTRRFRSTMERLPQGYFFESANRIFYQDQGSILPEYLRISEDVVGAKPEGVDFSNAGEARDIINTWVEKKTKNKIKELVPDGVIDEMVRIILVNAVYFKADWQTKFEASMTGRTTFFGQDNEETVVDMMVTTSQFSYKEDKNCQYKALELLYKGGNMSMVLILPRDYTNQFSAFEKCVLNNMDTVTKNMQAVNVHINIPKFKVTQAFDLKEPLKRMSIEDLFVPGKANLTGIDPSGELYVSDALHKAFIEVNEVGSEAAAATAMVGRGRSGLDDPVIMQFFADHPFLFFIKHNTGGIIFMGRVMNPTMN